MAAPANPRAEVGSRGSHTREKEDEGKQEEEREEGGRESPEEDDVKEGPTLTNEQHREMVDERDAKVGDRASGDRKAKLTRNALAPLVGKRVSGNAEAECHEADGRGRGEVEEKPRDEPCHSRSAGAEHRSARDDEHKSKVRVTIADGDVGGKGQLENETYDGENDDRASVPVLVGDLHQHLLLGTIVIGLRGVVRPFPAAPLLRVGLGDVLGGRALLLGERGYDEDLLG